MMFGPNLTIFIIQRMFIQGLEIKNLDITLTTTINPVNIESLHKIMLGGRDNVYT